MQNSHPENLMLLVSISANADAWGAEKKRLKGNYRAILAKL